LHSLFLRALMMQKSPTMRLHDLVGLVNSHYPQHLAEDWDNVGLQVGDLTQEITRVMVALDPALTTVNTAIEHDCQALITHHPLIFTPLKKISPSDTTGKILYTAIRNNLGIISAHTNLDHASDGLNDWLATTLQLRTYQPLLRPKAGALLKLVVYVPANAADAVADAMFKAGAGSIGKYDRCSFRSAGVGTFRAQSGCNPHSGTIGSDAQVDEIRLETIVARAQIKRVLERMKKQHPYEEVAFDVIPIENSAQDVGLGRIGRLDNPLKLEQFASQCKQQLNCTSMRAISAAGDALVSKVAVCGGSGASLIHEAARQGADVLVTGDVKYHEALSAQELGLAVIDAGHFATEHIMANYLANKLTRATQQRNWSVEFMVAPNEVDPFITI
jgi:dinuclear metal center YbgI/SA1388 family protein